MIAAFSLFLFLSDTVSSFLSRYTNKLYCDITAIVYDVTEHVHFLLVDSRFVCQLDVFGA